MDEAPRPPVVVLVTGPDEATLISIAEDIVGEGLAACMNVVPGVRSVYRWNDAVETGQEALGIIKTTKSAVPALERRVLALHPYNTPEFLVLSVDSGNPAYVGWIAGSVPEQADP